MRCICDNKGSATILTLLISAVLITVSIGFNGLVREHLKAAEGLKNKSEAMLKARSAYDALIYSILTGEITSKEIILTAAGESLLGVKSIPLNGKEVSLNGAINIRLQESNGMLSLTSLNTAALERLIEVVQPEEEAPAGIIDSLLDWIDTDKLVRISGAEDLFYSMEGRPYRPRNFPMQYKEEFGFIRGIDEDLYKRLLPHITMLPNIGFNPNTASGEVLMAYLDINKDILETLKIYISKKPVTSNSKLFSITGRRLGPDTARIYFYPSRFIGVTINAGSPRTIYSIKAGVDVRQRITSPYSIIYWREG